MTLEQSPDVPGSVAAEPPHWLGRLDSLAAYHDFRQLWLGTAVTQLGVQLALMAMPVLAVRALGADAFEMGLLTTFEMLAFLVIGLPAGAWVDRWRKKQVLIAGDVIRGLLLLTLPVAWLLDGLTIWHLYAVALGLGAATVFFDVAYQSCLPDLVPSARLGDANGRLQAVQSVSQVAGPALGGSMIRIIGVPFLLAMTGLCLLASVLFIRRIRHVEIPPPRSARRPLQTEIGEGLTFVLRHPLLVRITATTALSNLFSAITLALLVLYVLRDLGLSEASLGLALSAGAAGGLTGALLATRIGRMVGEGRTIPLAILAGVPFATLIPLASVLPTVPALMLGSFGVWFSATVYNVMQVSFRQRLCPKILLGRMNASIRFMVWGTMPIGGFLGGVLGAQFGILPTLWVAAIGSAVATAPVVFSPLMRMNELPYDNTR